MLDAVNCRTGDSLARERVQADSKEHILQALGEAATKLRRELGESLASIQKFDVPLQKATTPSLEALKAYTLRVKTRRQKGPAEAIPFYKRAVELDPNFAMAYDTLTLEYTNLGEIRLASEYAKKAFELRDRVSELEKLLISGNYYWSITGDLEQASQTYQLLIESYPHNPAAYGNLGLDYILLGQFEKAAAETRESLRLNPNDVVPYGNLGTIYLALNRFDETRAIIEQALARNLDSPDLHQDLYALAFLQGDAKAMEQQVASAAGRLGEEDLLLSLQSDTEAYSGHLEKARGLSHRAVEAAKRFGLKEPAADWEANAALREALFGNVAQARQGAAAALAIASGRDVQAMAALALAIAGDAARARALADDLAKRFPSDTLVNSHWLPAIRAETELNGGDPSQAIELLQAAATYELGEVLSTAGAWFRRTRVARPTCARARAAPPQGNSRNCSTIGVWCGIAQQRLWRISASLAPTRWPATRPRLALLTRTSSPCGKMLTWTSPSCSRPKPSTPS